MKYRIFFLILTLSILGTSQSFAQKNNKQSSIESAPSTNINNTPQQTNRQKPKDFLEVVAVSSGKGSDGASLIINKGAGDFKDINGDIINLDRLLTDSDNNYIQFLNVLSDHGFKLISTDVVNHSENIYRIYLLQKNQ